MQTMFILLFLITALMSVVYFIKFIIKLLRKQPAKRQLILSSVFFGFSLFSIIIFATTVSDNTSLQEIVSSDGNLDSKKTIVTSKKGVEEKTSKQDNNEQKIQKYKSQFNKGILKCIDISKQIVNTEDKSTIVDLKEKGKYAQVEAWDALILIQDEDLQFPRDKWKMMSNTYVVIGDIYANNKVLNLPPEDFKNYVSKKLETIESLESILKILEK